MKSQLDSQHMRISKLEKLMRYNIALTCLFGVIGIVLKVVLRIH